MKKVIVTLFIVMIVISGCGFKDIDKRFFVVSIGVDKAEDKEKEYKVSLKLAIPNVEAKNIKSEHLLVSEEAETISEAVRVIKSRVDKELDFGHTKILVLGKEVVESDISHILDWFMRRRDIQKIAWMTIGKPTAKEILDLTPKAERLPSNSLFLAFGEAGTESPYISSEYLYLFRRELYERGVDPHLPIVEIEEKIFKINTVSIFKDAKQVLKLNQDDTKTFNTMLRGYDKLNLKVETDEYHFNLSVDKVSRDFTIDTFDTGKPVIKYNM
jgi:spore germination protein KC